MLPHIAIQIPTYNQAQYIVDATKSALAQSYPHKKIIISDDHSTDDTLSLLKGLSTIEVNINPENIGRIKNYQTAFEISKSYDYMVNLDGDDYFTDPAWIEIGVNHLANHQNSLLYQAQFNFFDRLNESMIQKRLDNHHVIISGVDYILHSIAHYSFVHFATIFSTDAMSKVGAYIDDCLYADFYTAMRVATHGEVIVSDKSVGVWRAHNHNASNQRNTLIESAKNETAFYQFVQYAEDYLEGKDILRIIEAYELREFNHSLYHLASEKCTKEIIIKALAQKRFSIFVWKQFIKSLF